MRRGADGDISLGRFPLMPDPGLLLGAQLEEGEFRVERGGWELGGQAIPVRLHSASETVVPRTLPEPQTPSPRPQTSLGGPAA